ncbi:MAG: zinc-dependent metalloprotease family protein, partial [Phormidesmis sp.]
MKYSIRLPFGRVFSRSKSLPLLVGAALALGGCAEGGAQSVQSIAFGEADELFVQPIRVCDDNGKSCADVNLFEDITRKILEQAQLKVSFLPTNQLNASRFLRIEDARNRNSPDYEFYELTRTGGAGAFGRHPDSTRDSGPINVWFVDEIEAINGFTQFGVAWVGSNGVLVSQDSLDFNGGVGRTDTVAHEISHNLGLRHATLGAGSPKNLATDGDDRLIPSLLSDIGIDGAGL